MQKTMSDHKAASETRLRIRRKIKRMIRQSNHLCWGVAEALKLLDKWILEQDERQNKRAGGL